MSTTVYKPVGFDNATPLKDRSDEEKAWIIARIRVRKDAKQWCLGDLGMSEKAWKKYRLHAINKTTPQCVGRAPRISKKEGMEVANTIRESERKENSLLRKPHEGGGDPTLADLLQSAADRSNPTLYGNPLSATTIKNFKRTYDIGLVSAHARTVARDVAGNDVRNGISTLVAWFAILALGIKKNGLLNFDATQFMIDGFGTTPLEVWVCKNDESILQIKQERGKWKEPNKQRQTQPKNAPDSAIFIKWYAMIHSGGCSGPMVFVIADKRMGDTDCAISPVEGLHPTGDPTQTGYIIFCQSRSPPTAFYEWLHRTCIPIWVTRIRAAAVGNNDPIVITMDGEAVQIADVTSEEGKKAYERMNAIALKSCASTTHITQPCDAGFLFPHTKQEVKGNSNDVSMYAALHSVIFGVFDTHDQSFTKNRFDKSKKGRLAAGCVRIYTAALKKLNFKVQKNSFIQVGLLTPKDDLVDPMRVMKQFNMLDRVNTYEQTTFLDEVRGLVPQFVKQGYVQDSALEATNTFKVYKEKGLVDYTNTGRDKRALSRQRCVILNHDRVVALANERVQEKEAKAAGVASRQVQRTKKETLATLWVRVRLIVCLWRFAARHKLFNGGKKGRHGASIDPPPDPKKLCGTEEGWKWLRVSLLWQAVKTTGKKPKWVACRLHPRKTPKAASANKGVKRAFNETQFMETDGREYSMVTGRGGRLRKALVRN